METGDSMAETGGEADQIPGVEVVSGEETVVEAPEELTWDKDANIYLRLLRCRADAKRMEKKGSHKDRQDKEIFKYVKGDDVTEEANRLFVKHGICPIFTAIDRIEEALSKGLKTTIKCQLTCVNVDHPEDVAVFEAWGTGIDYSDKGDGKAYSYSAKNATSKALGFNSSDDIEADNTEYEKRASEKEVANAQVGVKEQMKAWADNLNAAIKGAQSLPELKEISRNNRVALLAEDLPEVTRNYFIELIEERKISILE